MLHRTPSLWVGSPKMRWGRSYPGRLVQEPGQRGATRTADWEKGALFGVKMFPWHCRMSSSCPHLCWGCFTGRGPTPRRGNDEKHRTARCAPTVGPSQVPFSSCIPQTIQNVSPPAEVLLGAVCSIRMGFSRGWKSRGSPVPDLVLRVCRLEGFTARWDKFGEEL